MFLFTFRFSGSDWKAALSLFTFRMRDLVLLHTEFLSSSPPVPLTFSVFLLKIKLIHVVYDMIKLPDFKFVQFLVGFNVFFQPSGDFGLDSTSISATVLSCCQSNEWPAALELLHWTSAMAGCPPTSHALATLISAVEDIPDVEVTCRVWIYHD